MGLKRTDFANIGETLYTGSLENGLRIVVVPRPGFMKKYAFFAANYGGAVRNFSVDGRRVETPEGVAHFLEHKMFDMPWGNALGVLSASGAQPNAYTSDFITAYHFECTDGFEKDLDTLLEFVSTPYFTAESVLKEQGIIGEEIGMAENDPGHAVYYGLMRCLYENCAVRDSVVGTVESIAQITPEILTDCHRAFYAPSNMLLCVVGDVEPDAVEAAAVRALPAERAPVPQPDYGPIEGLAPYKTRFSRGMDVSAPQFMIGAKLPCEGSGDELLPSHGSSRRRSPCAAWPARPRRYTQACTPTGSSAASGTRPTGAPARPMPSSAARALSRSGCSRASPKPSPKSPRRALSPTPLSAAAAPSTACESAPSARPPALPTASHAAPLPARTACAALNCCLSSPPRSAQPLSRSTSPRSGSRSRWYSLSLERICDQCQL